MLSWKKLAGKERDDIRDSFPFDEFVPPAGPRHGLKNVPALRRFFATELRDCLYNVIVDTTSGSTIYFDEPQIFQHPSNVI